MKKALEFKQLTVEVNGSTVVDNVSLTLPSGAIHALMGPNGSGKTSLSFALMGHPQYRITRGTVALDGLALESLSPDRRAKSGLFLSFQHPPAFEGVTVAHFLRTAYNAIHNVRLRPAEFRDRLDEKMRALDIETSFRMRPLNQGFSGGERKRMEMLQLAVLEPTYAILDETDSGLDVDGLKRISQHLTHIQRQHPMGLLVISHNPRLFELLPPDRVHVMLNGRLVRSGGKELLSMIEEHGYDAFRS